MVELVQIDDYRPSSSSAEALQTGGGGGTFDGMDTVDAKIAAAEARTDTKFAEMMGELRVISGRLDHVDKSTSGIKATVVAAAIGVLALTGGIFAYGSSMFATGMDAQAIAERAALAVEDRSAAQMEAVTARYDALSDQVGVIVQMLSTQREDRPLPELDFENLPERDDGASPLPMPSVE
jgi:hypothetical protein